MVGHQSSNFANDISRFFGAKATRNPNAIGDYGYSYASETETGAQFQSRGEHQWDTDNQASEFIQAGNHVIYGKKGWSFSQSFSHSSGNSFIDIIIYPFPFRFTHSLLLCIYIYACVCVCSDNPVNSVGNGVSNVDISRHSGVSDDVINSQSHGEATSIFVTPLAQSQN